MKNPFSQKTRELFDFGGYCMSWESGRNDADCLHHILGRISDSPYNACPLNNFREHMPEGRNTENLPALSNEKVISRYLLKTKKYLDSVGYKPTVKDEEFLDKYKKYY